MLRYNKEIPLGYRDVELEERILMNTYKKEGIREGEERGKEQRSLETAKYLLKKGFKEDIILGASGLTRKELNKLRANSIN